MNMVSNNGNCVGFFRNQLQSFLKEGDVSVSTALRSARIFDEQCTFVWKCVCRKEGRKRKLVSIH